jgi:hypothetical protein
MSNDMLHDSLLVTIGAEVTKIFLNAQGVLDDKGAEDLGAHTLKIVKAIEAADAAHEDARSLNEVDELMGVMREMLDKGQRREIASLAMMTLKELASHRSPTARHEVLALMLTYQQVSPASVNREHIDNIMKGFDDIAKALRESASKVKAG